MKYSGGRVPWNKGKRGVQIAWNKGLKKGKDAKMENVVGNKNTNSGSFKKGHPCYPVHPENEPLRAQRISASKKGVPNPHLRGERNHNWKGGVSSENRKARRSTAYKDWREAVFERDDYACQLCGDRGAYIHPHHIKYFATNPDHRFDIDNGMTLCRSCHKYVHGVVV